MLPQNLPDFDLLWDYGHPDQTETKFRGILLQFTEDNLAFLELLTRSLAPRDCSGSSAMRSRRSIRSKLEFFEKAEVWQRSKGRIRETRIATWCVARTLRSLGRVEEALSRQMRLKERSADEEDGYVFEEIGECMLALNRLEEARAYFAKAYGLLS
jgi:tetratricopeptide (TPR) repeat protein